jgi:putative ABC transport system permease protein
MSRTLWLLSWRHLRRHPWQMALAVLGVALGVAVVVAIDLANASASRAFALSAETISGRATHQIIAGPGGVPTALYTRLRLEQGIRAAAPLVEGAAVDLASGTTLQVLGVDPPAEAPFRPYLGGGALLRDGGLPAAFFTSPGAAIVSRETATRLGITAADGAPRAVRIGATTVSASIVAILEPDDAASRQALDGLMLVDIATAQEWFGAPGRLTRIDLILPDDAALERVRAALPPGAGLERPAQRSAAIQQMTAAFELNLSALSLLALVVGMFLIFNTISFSVVQRRDLLGMLRCLGVGRGQVLGLMLAEALLVALVGTTIGLGLGVALGQGLVALVAQTINDLYFTVSVRALSIGWIPLLKGAVLGIAATVLAAAIPAAEAAGTPPRTVLRRSSYEARVRQLIPWIATAGAGAILGGAALVPIAQRDLVLGFVALFAVTVGAAALTPALVLLAMRPAQAVLGRVAGLLGRMAARDVAAAISRTSVAIAALMIAVAVTIGVGLMVGSFRQTVARWLEQTLVADVYVAAPSIAANRLDQPVPPAVVERLLATPGIERVRRYRSGDLATSAGRVFTIALDVTAADRATFAFIDDIGPDLWSRFATDGVVISEPLAFHQQLAVGDALTIRTDRGPQAFTVVGVFYDYGNDRGVVMLPYERYRQLFDDPTITSLGVYADAATPVAALVERLRTAAGTAVLTIRSNVALRAASLEIFDRTFAITRVLQLLATIVAFIGILAALMALQLERARELGVMRATGLTPGQLWGLVLTQTGVMGLTAGLIAIPTGLAMALLLIEVINRRSFGWTLWLSVDPWLLAQAVLVALVAAILGGIYPAWRMSRTPPALALREE